MVHSCKLQSAVAAQASARLSAERLQRAVQLGQRESCGGASTVITYGSYDVHTDRSAALYGRSGPYGSRMNYHVPVTARMSRSCSVGYFCTLAHKRLPGRLATWAPSPADHSELPHASPHPTRLHAHLAPHRSPWLCARFTGLDCWYCSLNNTRSRSRMCAGYYVTRR